MSCLITCELRTDSVVLKHTGLCRFPVGPVALYVSLFSVSQLEYQFLSLSGNA